MASPARASRKGRSLPPPSPDQIGVTHEAPCVRARKNPRASSSSQEVSNVIIFLVILHANPLSFGSANHFLLQTEETSSGDVEEVPMPSATLDLATSTIAAAQVADPSKSTGKPIVTTSAVPPTLGELPLRADIAEKCRRLNEKKAALDAKTDTSANRAELEALRKELESLEDRVRVTKQLIQERKLLLPVLKMKQKASQPI
ncbi:hypothetical protein QYE76_005539 [Lolium multiflorum]|uniref:Uncharacterized protein n=1 Tax=Lolium multiflorum TaxID=4521 RepID=A0AAD8RU77_LOLMU|nr:hypothetical protein QYE76_005539 [Lolium multiflorum]